MPDSKPNLDLSVFADDYLIVGERDSPDGSRVFVANRAATDDARRRSDSTGVLITVVRAPAGDEGNALTQYAADTGALAGLTHRRLVPVIESRWIGDDAFGVVTPRVNDPTLAQKLLVGEEFHSTRIAAILREVNGLLEWAREQGIVHRRVTPDNIYLEPKTDRVRIRFGISPIKRLKQPGPHDDARTIARLAVAMLGGDPEIESCDEGMLMALRPGLPQLFCEATSRLLDPRDISTPDDVAAYLGLIGMADPLVEGETERDRIRAEVLEEQRLEREKLAQERAEFERRNAEERAAFDATLAGERAAYEKQIADERAAIEKAKADERARVERERLELQKAATREREELQAALAAERSALLARREELERTVAAQRAELERTAAADRAEIERLRASLRAAGDQEIEQKRLAALEDITGDEPSVLDGEELATPLFAMPVLPPIEPITFSDETPVLSEEPIVFEAPPLPAEEDAAPGEGAPRGAASSTRNRVLVGAAAVVLLVGGGIALFAGRSSQPAAPGDRTAVAPAGVGHRDSSAGTVAPAPVVAAVPSIAMADSATARAWLDSLKSAHPVDVSWAIDIASARSARSERAARAQAAAGAAAAQAPATGAQGVARATKPAPVAATPSGAPPVRAGGAPANPPGVLIPGASSTVPSPFTLPATPRRPVQRVARPDSAAARTPVVPRDTVPRPDSVVPPPAAVPRWR